MTDTTMEASLKVLADVRSQLEDLRANRASYIKSTDIDKIFGQLQREIVIIKQLDATTTLDDKVQRDVAIALDQDLQLISLFFMTIGRNKEAPAVYALCTITRILLNHLTESGVYSKRDLTPIVDQLTEMGHIVERGGKEEKYPVQIIRLLQSRIEECKKVLEHLLKRISTIPKELAATYEQLVSIRRQITAAGSRPKFVPAEITELQAKLKEIDPTKIEESTTSGESAAGKALVTDVYEQCIFIAAAIAARQMTISSSLDPTYLQLGEIKNALEKLALTHTWSLRETDLFDYLQRLRAIDEKRIDGKFIDDTGETPVEGQKILLYMLRKSYATIYELLNSSEPVSEALQPIYNQLSTLRKCLLEVKNSGGISSPRDLFPFSIKLASIDNLKKDGKFYVGNEIPEGQASLGALLAECFDICQELRCDADEED